MKSCEEWQAQIEPYLDGALTRDEEQRFLTHISSCLECSEALEFAKAVRASLSGLPGIDVPDDFCEKLHERIDAERIKRRTFGTYAKRYGALAACVVLAVVVKSGVGEYDFTKSGEGDENIGQYTAATSKPSAAPVLDLTATVQGQETGGISDNTPTNDKINNEEQQVKEKRAEPTAKPQKPAETVAPVVTAAPVQQPTAEPVVSSAEPTELNEVVAESATAAPEPAEASADVAAVSMYTLADEVNSDTAENTDRKNEEAEKRVSGGGGGGGSSSSAAAASGGSVKSTEAVISIKVSAEKLVDAKTVAEKYAVYSGGVYTAEKAAYGAFLQELARLEITYTQAPQPQDDTVSFIISEL